MADLELRVRHGKIIFEDQGGLEVTSDGKARILAEELESVLRVKVYNDTVAQIADNALVYVSGDYAPVGGKRARTIALADANSATLHPAQYIVDGAIAASAYGYVKKAKDPDALNTGGSAVDAPVWLSETAGGWTLTEPSAAASQPQVVGRVKVVDAAVGQIHFSLSGDAIMPHAHSGAGQGGTLGSGALTFEPVVDIGRPTVGFLRITGNSADTETLVVSTQTYELDTNGAVTPGNVAVNIAADQTPDAVAAAIVAAINGDATRRVDAIVGPGNDDNASTVHFIEVPTAGGVAGVNLTLQDTMGNGAVSGATTTQADAAADRQVASDEFTVLAIHVTTWAGAAGLGDRSVVIGGFALDTATRPKLTSFLIQTVDRVFRATNTCSANFVRVNTNFWELRVTDPNAVMAATDTIGWSASL